MGIYSYSTSSNNDNGNNNYQSDLKDIEGKIF